MPDLSKIESYIYQRSVYQHLHTSLSPDEGKVLIHELDRLRVENESLRGERDQLRAVLVEIRNAECDDAEWPGEVPCRSFRKDRDVWCGACLAADALQKLEELPDV